MDKVELLKIKRLFKELEYVESDFEYRSELVSDADNNFLKSISIFLEKNTELKELYDSKVNEKLDQIISNQQVEVQDFEFDDTDVISIEILPKVRKLYREIVKITHPDKSSNKGLNEIYMTATEYYNINDKIGIYKLCSDLGIMYDIEPEETIEIEKKINELKNRIDFIESTFAYKWFISNNEDDKNMMMINYIKMRIQ